MPPVIAFVFPGQASQRAGMAAGLMAEEQAAAVFRRADELLQLDLAAVCATGSDEELTRTEVAQPALFTTSLAWLEIVLGKGLVPRMVAGHSVGEFAAWVAAGVLSLEQGLRLVGERGKLMAEAAERNPGSMLAIMGLAEAQVGELCQSAQEAGLAVVANLNSPNQVVVSGQAAALEQVGQGAKEAGGMAVPLRVTGAFHSPLMAEAARAFTQSLSTVEIGRPRMPVVANTTAQPVEDASQAREAMSKQMTSPVRWTESVQRMVADGVDTFVEVGPGRVLTKLIARIAPEARGVPVENLKALQSLVEEVGS